MCVICGMTGIPACTIAGGCGLTPHDIMGLGAVLAAGGVGTARLWITPKSGKKKNNENKKI